jgi:WD repeat-containing protein 48
MFACLWSQLLVCAPVLQAVPYSLSIATVKKYIWKRSDDVIFNYRVLDPARLAPLPTFGPDS